MNWKDFFYYNRGNRSAVLLLLILILLTLILNTLLGHKKSSEPYLSYNDSIINEFAKSRGSLNINDYSESNVIPRNSSGYSNSQRKQENSFTDQRRSLTDQTDGFKNYEKDSSRMITGSSQNYNNSEDTRQGSYSTNYPQIDKLKEGETIALNETDTTQWKMIPGIGSSYASRIVKYKNLLGGYVFKEQLMEVYGIDNEMYSRIEKYIVEDSNYIKLKVNEMEFRDLLRHPYLDYEQVQSIVNLRGRKGGITSIDELSMLNEFTQQDIERLKPYLQFN